MDDERAILTDVEFAIADAEWRHEVAQVLGRPIDDDDTILPFGVRNGELHDPAGLPG